MGERTLSDIIDDHVNESVAGVFDEIVTAIVDGGQISDVDDISTLRESIDDIGNHDLDDNDVELILASSRYADDEDVSPEIAASYALVAEVSNTIKDMVNEAIDHYDTEFSEIEDEINVILNDVDDELLGTAIHDLSFLIATSSLIVTGNDLRQRTIFSVTNARDEKTKELENWIHYANLSAEASQHPPEISGRGILLLPHLHHDIINFIDCTRALADKHGNKGPYRNYERADIEAEIIDNKRITARDLAFLENNSTEYVDAYKDILEGEYTTIIRAVLASSPMMIEKNDRGETLFDALLHNTSPVVDAGKTDDALFTLARLASITFGEDFARVISKEALASLLGQEKYSYPALNMYLAEQLIDDPLELATYYDAGPTWIDQAVQHNWEGTQRLVHYFKEHGGVISRDDKCSALKTVALYSGEEADILAVLTDYSQFKDAAEIGAVIDGFDTELSAKVNKIWAGIDAQSNSRLARIVI